MTTQTKKPVTTETDALDFKKLTRVKEPEDVVKSQSRLLRAAAKGGVSERINNLYKMTMMSSMLLKSIQDIGLKRRVDELEKKVKKDKPDAR
jgi:hypothetical protein